MRLVLILKFDSLEHYLEKKTEKDPSHAACLIWTRGNDIQVGIDSFPEMRCFLHNNGN